VSLYVDGLDVTLARNMAATVTDRLFNVWRSIGHATPVAALHFFGGEMDDVNDYLILN
jgi:hypothetical protein